MRKRTKNTLASRSTSRSTLAYHGAIVCILSEMKFVDPTNKVLSLQKWSDKIPRNQDNLLTRFHPNNVLSLGSFPRFYKTRQMALLMLSSALLKGKFTVFIAIMSLQLRRLSLGSKLISIFIVCALCIRKTHFRFLELFVLSVDCSKLHNT